MKRIHLFAASLAIVASLTASAADNGYTLTFNDPTLAGGETLYLVDYDNGAKVDSVVASAGVATFEGTIDEPILARVMCGSKRKGMLFLEPGQLTMTNGNVSGSKLNDDMTLFEEDIEAIQHAYAELDEGDEETAQKLFERYDLAINNFYERNADNIIGYYIFINRANEMSAEEFNAEIEKNPSLAKYERVKKMSGVYERQAATAPGKMFTDFEVTYDGETHRLSDYVGKGKHTLVDFWASWCGPCIREIAVVKELHQRYGDALDIVSFAVWDKPEDTVAAIKQHNLDWPQVIDAQNIPTDLYGIIGIPCIILFAPDGTIISRSLQGDALRRSVADALAAAAE